jgi:hypothetical protein
MLDDSDYTETFRKECMQKARLLKNERIIRRELDVYYDQLRSFLSHTKRQLINAEDLRQSDTGKGNYIASGIDQLTVA